MVMVVHDKRWSSYAMSVLKMIVKFRSIQRAINSLVFHTKTFRNFFFLAGWIWKLSVVGQSFSYLLVKTELKFDQLSCWENESSTFFGIAPGFQSDVGNCRE